ncbi:MAG: glycine cleavage system protein R [Nitrospinaceae bacterium]
MKNWFMVTLVGKDQPGIVAKVSSTLFQGDCNLGEASMSRLGGNFTIMLMVHFSGSRESLETMLFPLSDSLNLRCHVDLIEGELHHHVEPNIRVSVHGADRAGIVAEVTGTLAEAGFNILNLESDVGGTADHPLYIMYIEGVALCGIDDLKHAIEILADKQDVEIQVSEIDILRG